MKEEKIVIKNNRGQNLVGILYSPSSDETKSIVIYCHGYRSDKKSPKVIPLAKKITLNNMSLFAFDFSGRGESEGKFEDTTITQYISDLDAIVDYFSNKNKKIGIIGNSLGGLISLQESAKDKRIKSLVLLSPVSYFPWSNTEEYSKENLEKWKKQGSVLTEHIRFGKMKINYSFYEDGLKYQDFSVYDNIKMPILVIHGIKDTHVSIEFSDKLVSHIKNSKLIKLEGTGHNYGKKEYIEKVVQETVKFLGDTL